MSPPRYERVFDHDHEDTHNDDHDDNNTDETPTSSTVPSQSHDRQQSHPSQAPSPPPSFRSRASSLNRRDESERSHLVSDADRALADAFDAPSDDDSDDGRRDGLDERQRALSGRHSTPPASSSQAADTHDSEGRPTIERTVTQMPVFPSTSSSNPRVYGAGSSDGVFANLSAKPTRGEDADEKPPPYEQAAADAAPPYWETTILAPGANSDEVFIDGLPVGSLFSFIWNGMISMSFQLVGFLLTYLLHTTHAAKNGSKAGLGITLIQYGFSMKGSFAPTPVGEADPSDGSTPVISDPNSHDIDPSNPSGGGFVADPDAPTGMAAMRPTDWFAYALMVMGWFVLIRAIGEYVKARRHEQLVLQSPSRGLNVAVVAEGERAEGAV